MKKIISLFLAFAVIFMISGCGNTGVPDNTPPAGTTSAAPSPQQSKTAGQDQTKAFPVTVSDSRDAEVTFEKSPEKVISLMPSDTEILYALGLGDKIIAVSQYCNYPEDTRNKRKLPTGEQLDIEALIGLQPDVVFIGKMSAVEDQINQLEEAGIKVIVTEANKLDETYEIIRLMGIVMGRGNEAENIVKTMQESFDEIREQVKGKTPKTVYVEVSPLQYGLWSCGENTFVQELIDIIGAKNTFDDVEGWAAVSEEQVLERDPDIILTTASPLTGIEDPVGEISSRPNWSDLKAVRNKRVIMLDNDMITRPGPRLLDAAKELVKAVYGE